MQNQAGAAPAGNEASNLFVLTDEQILEIEPQEAGRDQASAPARVVSGSLAAPVDSPLGNASSSPLTDDGRRIAENPPPEPPHWLADMMNDPQAGSEARDLWNGVQQARNETAAYREVFAKPEQARAAAEHARALEEIDSAFFGGAGKSAQEISAGRTALAQRMLHEDPAAFREMVFAGLRAIESAGQNSGHENVAAPTGSGPSGNSASNSAANAEQDGSLNAATTTPSQKAQLAEYRNFEKSANDDLERSVGSSIQRSLQQALPNLPSADRSAIGAAQNAAPLQTRLQQAVRDDVEAALKSDRQLGEQLGRLRAARRFDETTRSQVVRLINDRAQQLVPVAARRVIQEWTQTAFAARRDKSVNVAPGGARPDQVGSPASGGDTSVGRSHSLALLGSRDASTRASVPSAKAAAADRAEKSAGLTPRGTARPNGRAVDYHRLTDEQILDL